MKKGFVYILVLLLSSTLGYCFGGIVVKNLETVKVVEIEKSIHIPQNYDYTLQVTVNNPVKVKKEIDTVFVDRQFPFEVKHIPLSLQKIDVEYTIIDVERELDNVFN